MDQVNSRGWVLLEGSAVGISDVSDSSKTSLQQHTGGSHTNPTAPAQASSAWPQANTRAALVGPCSMVTLTAPRPASSAVHQDRCQLAVAPMQQCLQSSMLRMLHAAGIHPSCIRHLTLISTPEGKQRQLAATIMAAASTSAQRFPASSPTSPPRQIRTPPPPHTHTPSHAPTPRTCTSALSRSPPLPLLLSLLHPPPEVCA
mgnify:CR=1 FL=1